MPRKPPFWKASFDLTTQLSCVPSFTQLRNAGVSSPGTFAASSISFSFFPKASSVSCGWLM